MHSKKQGTKYIIQEDPNTVPEKVSRKATDEGLKKLIKGLQLVETTLHDTYRSNPEVYRLITGPFEQTSLSCDEGKCWHISYILSNLKELQSHLQTHDDTIVTEEQIISLADMGYKNDFRSPVYGKLLVNTDEQEITDEIVLLDSGENVRRFRYITWEQIPGGRHSSSIVYRKKKITKALNAAAEVTRKEIKDRD